MLPIFTLVFAVELLSTAFPPLAPSFADRFQLSQFQLGSLFAATNLTMLVVSFPLGLLVRSRPRRMTIAAAGVVAVSAAGQGIASSFAALLVSRALLGFGVAAIWTAGLALLADISRSPTRVLATTLAVAGVADTIGPTLAGATATHFGTRTPFVAIMALTLASLIGLFRVPSPPTEHHAPSDSVRAAARALPREAVILGAVAVVVITGLTASVTDLLVPLQLHDNGLTSGAIGLVYSLAGVFYVAMTALTSRLGARATSLESALLVIVGIAVVLVVPAISMTTAALATYLIIRQGMNGAGSTIAYALGSAGAVRAGIYRGPAIGLVNSIWAGTTVIGPLAGGALAEAIGRQAVFAALMAFSVLTGGIVFGVRSRDRRPQPSRNTGA
jgi:predicted MFS family arabinose efflux permease